MVDNLFAPLPPETRRFLQELPPLIDKVFPLPGRFRSALPADVAELSRLLTSGRGERGLSYLGRPALLSAYLRFFVPWNIYRLGRLLPGLAINLAANDRVTDLGCGPLTFAAALWICRPDLRTMPLEFHCVDRSGPALDAGRKLFAALAGENSPWKIHTHKGELGAVRLKPAALVCAINVFNEMYGDIAHNGSENLPRGAEKSARLLESYGAGDSAFLVVEPGLPRCGEFISLLRTNFMERGRHPLAPCPHSNSCPFPGGKSKAGKNRWCHFAFETDDAPQPLHKLSSAAGIPKERAVLSFLFTGPSPAAPPPASESLRIISDAFPLPPREYGRYCCARQGLVLLKGEQKAIERTVSGMLVNSINIQDKRDPKSGALLAELAGH